MWFICVINCLSIEPTIFIVIPNQSFNKGFWLHWRVNDIENIPQELISLQVNIGDQQWLVGDAHKLSEFVELPLEGDNFEVNITVSVGNVWSEKITTIVTNIPVESK